ncbi:TPA: methionyl-tRNA formyltransferase [bacterium]|nr:methionyl-tRNA formyltransferase [bacterium]
MSEDNIKIIFMGTGDFSAFVLEGLIKNNYQIIGVVSQPDKVVGRKKELVKTETKKVAEKYGIEVFQPVSIRKDYQFIKDKNPDLIITCAYGQIVPRGVLEIPKYKCINVHGSLLPKLRGASPIQQAIMDDEKETGITIMEMVEKMDAGDMISSAKLKIDNEDTSKSLFLKMQVLGLDLLLDTLPKYLKGEITPIKQDESKVTFAPLIKREDEKLNLNDTRRNIYNKIRALNEEPGAYALLDDEIIKIYEAVEIDKEYKGENGQIVDTTKDLIIVKVSDGALGLKRIKPASKKVMLVRDYLNGKNNLVGKVFK